MMVLDLDLMVGGYNATFLLYYTELSVWAHPTIFLAHITWSFLGIKVGVFFTQGAQQLAAFYLFQKKYIYNLQKYGTFFFVFLVKHLHESWPKIIGVHGGAWLA